MDEIGNMSLTIASENSIAFFKKAKFAPSAVLKKRMWTSASSRPRTKTLKKRLQKADSAKTFYYRLSVIPILVPPFVIGARTFRFGPALFGGLPKKQWKNPSRVSRRKP